MLLTCIKKDELDLSFIPVAQMRNTCSFSTKSDRGRPFGSSRCTWVDNIKSDHNEEDVD